MEPEVEKALSDILGRVDAEREVLEKDLLKFIEYGVPLNQAKEAVISKYGGSVQERKLNDINAFERNIAFIAKILTVEPREITVLDEKKTIYRGLLGDDTAVIPFTAWKDFELTRGDVYHISNASTNEWEGQPRMSLSEWTKVMKADKDITVPQREMRSYSLIDLKPGLSNVEIKGKILSVDSREVQVGDTTKQVFSGIIADATASVRFTAWHDFNLTPNTVLGIKGGYVKKWRGAPQLVFDEKAAVESLSEDIPIKQETVVPLHKVVDADGGINLTIHGDILEIRKGSGIILRCPKCNRRIRDGICDQDGEVEGIEDFRIKAIIDDGSGAVDVLINKELSEKILGKTLQQYQKMVQEAMDYDSIYDDITNRLLSMPVEVKGDSLSSDYIVTIYATDIQLLTIDVKKEADDILAELGDMNA